MSKSCRNISGPFMIGGPVPISGPFMIGGPVPISGPFMIGGPVPIGWLRSIVPLLYFKTCGSSAKIGGSFRFFKRSYFTIATTTQMITTTTPTETPTIIPTIDDSEDVGTDVGTDEVVTGVGTDVVVTGVVGLDVVGTDVMHVPTGIFRHATSGLSFRGNEESTLQPHLYGLKPKPLVLLKQI